jgi:class 3 adenylate cyclase
LLARSSLHWGFRVRSADRPATHSKKKAAARSRLTKKAANVPSPSPRAAARVAPTQSSVPWPVGSDHRTGRRTHATIVFVHLRGLTRLSSRAQPNVTVELLASFFSVMADVAVSHRAAIDRLVGDALMLVYGLDRPRRQHGPRAVAAALDMQRSFLALRNRWLREGKASGVDLGLGIGIASGDVVVAPVGVAGPDCTIVGEPIQMAGRLSMTAQQGEILIDEATYRPASAELEGRVVFTSRELTLKNREPVAAYRAQRIRAGLQIVPQREVSDPVCGTHVSPRRAVRRQMHGRTYYFCSVACAQRFETDPDGFQV